MSAVFEKQRHGALSAGEQGPGEKTAKSIITMLQQAAEAARHNEERARSKARHWHQYTEDAAVHRRRLETEIEQLERRAREAEQALEQINGAIQDILLAPLAARNSAGAA